METHAGEYHYKEIISFALEIKAPSTRAIFMWQFSMLQFLFARVDDEK